MLISKAMNEALNEQVGHEFGASMQYVAIACYFDGEGLPMLARHFFKQSEEERQHALKFVRYVLDAGGSVVVPAIPAQKATFASAEEAVSLSRDWELTVTKQINAIMDRAISEKDHVTKHFLEWFMEEQLEEVSSMDTLLRMVKRAGEKGLLFVENYLQGGKGVPGRQGDSDAHED